MADTKSSAAANRARLVEIVKARSFQEGPEMRLASGKLSTFYFNMKPTMLDSEGAHLIASLILDQLDGVEADLIGGLEMGAVPIAASVTAVAHARGRKLPAFFVRKQAKEHGTKSLIEGLARDETMAGKRVVIVEDVTTTGGSAIKAAEAIRASGATIVRVITIVDRQDGADEAFKTAAMDFQPLLTLADFRK
ncbi:MAG: orotate phosphoribosyltransferase [Hyphomicrobium sp.]|nr:orotate phosphoribosyltransferase [Hyphomicrobium sp.]